MGRLVLAVCVGVCLCCLPSTADMNGNFPKNGNYKAWQTAGRTFNAGLAASRAGDKAHARVLLQQAVNEYPADAGFNYELGHFLEGEHQLPDAEHFLQRSVTLQPTMQNLAELAVVLAQEKKWIEAESAMRAASRYAVSADEKAKIDQLAKFIRDKKADK